MQGKILRKERCLIGPRKNPEALRQPTVNAMGKITLRQAAQWCGGRVEEKYADVTFCGASNDTRTLQPGQLFVALKALRDGHDFVNAAFEKGAAAVLCSRVDGDYPAIIVEDTRIALGDIAR